MANFKDGVIREGNTGIGNGTILGNIQNGIIRKGNNAGAGVGTILGNVKDGIIREGDNAGAGVGKIIGNVKDGIVREGNNAGAGVGKTIGRVGDFSIKGMERENEAEIVAAYHFLVKNIISNATDNQAKKNTTRNSSSKKISSFEQLGAEHGAMLGRFLVKIFGETGTAIIFLAIFLYLFRGFFMGFFTEPPPPPPIKCVGLCANEK